MDAFFVLNHTPASEYDDVTGHRYGFDEDVTSWRLLVEPEAGWFVYYNTKRWRGAEPRSSFAGYGFIHGVDEREPDEAGRRRWVAHLERYTPFTVPVPLRDLTPRSPQSGNRWNFQHGIALIRPEDFRELVRRGLELPTEPTDAEEQLLFGGGLDRLVETRARGEQQALRASLLAGQPVALCALCGRRLPSDLLVAAHIKRRSACSTEERRDLNNVAMLACTLGCDALYERGYIGVDEGGAVLTSPEADETMGDLLSHLAGRRCLSFKSETAVYYAWHRKHAFRG